MTQSSNCVNQLLARSEITEALYVWANCLDRSEYHGLSAIWAPDCRFATYESQADYEADRPAMRGNDREDSIAKLGGLLSRIGQTHHLIGNVRISIDDDQANVESLVRTYHASNRKSPPGFWESLARMYIEFRRDGEWMITRQDYVVLVGLGTQDIFRRSWTQSIHPMAD